MDKVNIYIDFDWMRLGSIELLGRLMNKGVYPKKVLRSHKSGHWIFFFQNNKELRETLDIVAEPDYNIVYNEDVQ